MKQFVMTILVSLALLLPTANAQDFQQMLANIDANTRFPGDLAATVTLEIRDPQDGDDRRQIQFFRRDADDKFLLLVQAPETQLGQGYLNLDDGLWFYDPESRQFTFTSLDESFEDSDARNSDFEGSSLSEDYRVLSSSEGTLGSFDVWILDLEATNDEVTYPFRKIWVTKDPNLILKSEDYSLTERLLRTSYFPSYTRAGGSFIADEQLFVDALVSDKSTRVVLDNVSTNTIPDNVFSKAYVERVNR